MIKRQIKRIAFDTMVRLVWSKKINLNFKKNEFSEQIAELKKSGVIKINKNYSEFADYISKEYIDKILKNEKTEFPIFQGPAQNNEAGTAIACDLPLNDKRISDFILDKKICGLMEQYYGGKCYLRADPLLQRIETNVESLEKSNSNFHVDRYMQFNLFLLLSDTDEKTTHTDFLISSHKRKFLDPIIHKEVDECKKMIDVDKYKTFSLTGKKGDAFIFNTIGMHRANHIAGTTRNLFALMFTNGHNLYSYKNIDNQNLKFIDSKNFDTINRKSKNLVFYNEKKKGGNFQYFKFQT
jgi:hypothetical protein